MHCISSLNYSCPSVVRYPLNYGLGPVTALSVCLLLKKISVRVVVLIESHRYFSTFLLLGQYTKSAAT
jgi:hypothetical protein